ncbi:helix-turn-helix domain-containing protein [Streptomyces sp. NPDC090231]|uniref:helix-turn-helix domain-containing protein n=1 Tax=unclassified Streptomyces TaxID=2593676 RepID=UPI0038120A46
MPVRKPPTARQRRLGAELRRMREHAGLSLTDAAVRHRVDKTAISNTEAARFGVSPDRVRVWASNYSCPDQAYVDALADMARERGSSWWGEYRDSLPAELLDLAEMEHHASMLRSAQIMHIPGILQQPDYMRAIFAEAVPAMRPETLDRHTEFRIRRAALLDRADPPPCEFVIHESALRMRFGDRNVLRRQLEYMLEQSDRPGITLRIVPFEAGGFANAGSSILYACGPVSALDTVQIDVPTGATFLDAENYLVNYRAVLDRMRERAIGPEASVGFIREVAKGI